MDILSIVIISISVIIAFTYLIFAVKKQGLRKVAISLIVQAETMFEYGMNSEKFNFVFDRLYEAIPTILKLFFTKERVIEFIQMIFNEIKEALDYNNIKV